MRYGEEVTTAYITKKLQNIVKVLNQLTSVNLGVLNTANFVGLFTACGEYIEPMNVSSEQYMYPNSPKSGVSSDGKYSFLYELKKEIDDLNNR